MKIRLVPNDCTCSVICCWAPRPMDISVITAATPMITPSMVRMPRSLLARSARKATRTASNAFMSVLLHRQTGQDVGGAHWVLDPLVVVHATVANVDDAIG